jgi:hypothetical protein
MMIERRLLVVCLALTGITLLSWWIGVNDGHHAFTLNAGITFAVILAAALKVRVIAWEFMELRQASERMRRTADTLLASIIAALLILYIAGLHRSL